MYYSNVSSPLSKHLIETASCDGQQQQQQQQIDPFRHTGLPTQSRIRRAFGKGAPAPPSPLCDYCQRETYGQFASPNYPSSYGANARCSYRIEPVDGFCQVEMYWHDFDLESSPGCHKDMVALDGVHYCANDLKKKSSIFDFPTATRHPEIKILLQSDSYVEGRGFHMEYRQLKCNSSSSSASLYRRPPEALTLLRKSPHEQTVKTALFIGNTNDQTGSGRTADIHGAVGAAPATTTDRHDDVKATAGGGVGGANESRPSRGGTPLLHNETATPTTTGTTRTTTTSANGGADWPQKAKGRSLLLEVEGRPDPAHSSAANGSASGFISEKHSEAPTWTKFAKPTPAWR